MTLFRFIAASILILLLSACGGGKKDSPTLTGVFLDSPVQGLNYKTDTLTGITNEHGEFSYRVGENISFYLGNVFIGTAPASNLVNPLNLNSNTSTDAVRNLVRLLQTFDEDRDPENGINIIFTDGNKPSGSITINC